MTTYAAIKKGFVIDVFTPLPEWSDIPVETMFAPGAVDEWVPIDGIDPPPTASGWTYDGAAFHPPDEASIRGYIALWENGRPA